MISIYCHSFHLFLGISRPSRRLFGLGPPYVAHLPISRRSIIYKITSIIPSAPSANTVIPTLPPTGTVQYPKHPLHYHLTPHHLISASRINTTAASPSLPIARNHATTRTAPQTTIRHPDNRLFVKVPGQKWPRPIQGFFIHQT